MTTDKMVTIPQSEYKELLDSQRFLNALGDCGVDNWCGFSLACAAYYGEEGPEDD